jgi:hypothetical protein
MTEQIPRLGEILIKLGLVTQQQVQHALDAQKHSRTQIGEVMVAAGIITRVQLNSALAAQRRWARGGVVGLALMALQPAAALAGGSAVFNLTANIPATSTIRLAQASVPLPTDLRRPIDHAVITSITERSNSRGAYTVMIVSDAAQSNGQPALVNAESGAAIPYRLTYGDQDLHFDGDRAVIERPSGKASQAQTIAISTQPNATLAPGKYGDRLTIVLSAR